MKSFLKKFLATVCVVSTVLTYASIAVYATDEFRTGPNSGDAVTDTVESSTVANIQTSTTGGAEEPQSVTTQAKSSVSSKYLTKWGAFFWFLLSVVVNFFVACWVGNRFYRLARRSAQSSSEIRALRKDIEEKFSSTLKDIDEPVTEVVNSNESFARTEEGMDLPAERPSVEINDEEREILGRWDRRREVETEAQAQKMREEVRREYAPTRRMSGIEFGDEDGKEEAPEEKSAVRTKLESLTKAGSKVGGKAKDFLANIFPFDEE